MKKILLHSSKKLYALVDDAAYDHLSSRKWYVSAHGYAVSTSHKKGQGRGSKGRNINVSMHRLIMEAGSGIFVDHINGNRLDNRRSNLRLVTPRENCWNRKLKSAGYIGVSLAKSGKWRVRVDSTQYGEYDDAKTAALVYDHVVRKLRGPIATVNLPNERLTPYFKITNLTDPPRKAVKKSGVAGVVWHTGRDKWRVIVKKKSYGYFSDLSEAIVVRRSL